MAPMSSPGRSSPDELVGREVPGGRYSVADYESRIAHDTLYSTPEPTPHPMMAFIGAQRGMGCSVAELFALLDSDIDDGPMLAGSTIEFERDLAVDERYRVTGKVVGAIRKHGVSMGDFDLVTCIFTLSDDNDVAVGTVTNVYAIGRST